MTTGVKITDLTAASTFTGAEVTLVVQGDSTLKGTAAQFADLVASTTATIINKTISGTANTITNISLAAAVTGTLAVINGGTGVSTSTGIGSVVLSNSPTLVTPTLGAASATSLNASSYLAVGGSRYTSGVITATAAFSGTNVTLSSVSQLNVGPGMVIAGSGVTTGTKIVSFQSGTSGGDGVYAIDTSQTHGPVSVTIQGWADATVIGRLAVSTTASAGDLYDTGDINVLNGTSAGAQLVLRSNYALGPSTSAYIQFSNDTSDQDMVIALNNSLQTAFSAERGGYIAMNYGSWQLVTNYQTASPRTWLHLNGVTKGSAEGRFGFGGITDPSYDYTFGAQDNTSTTDLVVTRANQGYGVKLSNNGSTGHSTLSTFGTGADLNISATGTLALTAPALGTPVSGTLTNCTGLPVSTGVSGLAANVATFLATPSSANLAAAITDETGSGALPFGVGDAWTAYTPTVSSGGGSITTSSASGRYKQVGKMLMFQVQITVTTNGTGSGSLNFTLPNSLTAKALCTVIGRETQATGKIFSGTVSAATGTVTCTYYDNTYPGADNTRFNVGGVIEVE